MYYHSIHTLTAILTRFFPLHKTRLETMAVIIIGLCLSRTVNLGFLAQHFCNVALPTSNDGRWQRFFQAIRIDPTTLARLLIRIARLRRSHQLALRQHPHQPAGAGHRYTPRAPAHPVHRAQEGRLRAVPMNASA